MSAPDFYRIVRVSNGRRLYAACEDSLPAGADRWFDPKSGDAVRIAAFPTREAAQARLDKMYRGYIVPVRLVVRKKRGFGWALKQLKAGNSVRRESWDKNSYTYIDPSNPHSFNGVKSYGDGNLLSFETVTATDWELSDRRPPSYGSKP